MNPRKRVYLLISIMVIIGLIIESITIAMLYRTAFNERADDLRDTVASQARLIEAIDRFDRINGKDYPRGVSDATLSQIIDAHSRYAGFGQTGRVHFGQKARG